MPSSSAQRLAERTSHGDATVDLARLWAELPVGLDSVERFAASIAQLLATAPAH